MTSLPPSRTITGGPRERAQLFREAIANRRTISVGYRPGGKLAVRDLTGMDLTLLVRRYRDPGPIYGATQ